MKVLSVDGLTARCSALGVERELNLLLVQADGIQPGDHLVAHRGQALRRVSAQEAEASLDLFGQLLADPALGPVPA